MARPAVVAYAACARVQGGIGRRSPRRPFPAPLTAFRPNGLPDGGGKPVAWDMLAENQ
jgi:hypothetical protein